MFVKFPKSDKRFHWTTHIKNKMLFYAISQAQINRIFRHPERVEEGIAEDTLAAMKSKKKNRGKTSKQKGPDQEEIWIMYRVNEGSKAKNKSRVVLISTWRYPGKTKKGQRPQIPEGLLDELKQEGLI